MKVKQTKIISIKWVPSPKYALIDTVLNRVLAICVTKQEMEIKRLRKYESLVRFIASDYCELSYDKAMWQREDWQKRCRKLIEEDND